MWLGGVLLPCACGRGVPVWQHYNLSHAGTVVIWLKYCWKRRKPELNKQTNKTSLRPYCTARCSPGALIKMPLANEIPLLLKIKMRNVFDNGTVRFRAFILRVAGILKKTKLTVSAPTIFAFLKMKRQISITVQNIYTKMQQSQNATFRIFHSGFGGGICIGLWSGRAEIKIRDYTVMDIAFSYFYFYCVKTKKAKL